MIDQQDDINTHDWTGNFFSNSSEVVIQQVYTRLNLWVGEWFMNTADGTPWTQDILGKNTNYDLEIKSRILGTAGVTSLQSYTSFISNRLLNVSALINTQYGTAPLNITLGGN